VSGGIYLVGEDDELVEMTEQPYDSEAILQELLAKYPNLLAGDQMDSDSPRRWLLVRREMGVPSQELESGRWSVDHLFLDQDGIPTLIEVKRSSDTRLRREVVGQLLEYAANSMSYWPVEAIKAEFEGRCEKEDLDPYIELTDSVVLDGDPDAYWQRVETNLRAGRLRLVFVADVIPRELRKIVEFLNEQMTQTDVFAVEVKQYTGEGHRSLVPRIIGQTERKRTSKASSERWTETAFMRCTEETGSAADAETARHLLEWARSRDLHIYWGSGRRGSFVPSFLHGARKHQLFAVWCNSSSVELYFRYYRNKPPFTSEERRIEIVQKLNRIEGVDLGDDAARRLPTIPLSVLLTDAGFHSFVDTMEWMIEEIRKT